MEAKQIFTSSWPICGRTLLKGTPNSYIEVWCPKCREYLKINFMNEGFQACVIVQDKSSNKIMLPKR